jgi:hypothetical protein
MVAKFRERLAVNKQRSQRFHMEKFKLNKVEGKESITLSSQNRFAALEDFDAEVLEVIREN